MMSIPLAILVIGAALISSLHPFLIGVTAMVLASAKGAGKSKRDVLAAAGIFVASLTIFYLVVSLAFLYLLRSAPAAYVHYLSLIIAVVVTLLGIIEVKEYFWCSKGLSVRPFTYFTHKIHEHSTRVKSHFTSMKLGVLAGFSSLPCIGSVLLALIVLLHSTFTVSANWLLALFTLLLMSPLCIVSYMAARGSKISTIIKWKEESKGSMRLFYGVLLISLGWVILLIAAGTVNFG